MTDAARKASTENSVIKIAKDVLDINLDCLSHEKRPGFERLVESVAQFQEDVRQQLHDALYGERTK